jgi:Fur family ferric uptake transcriptional regulator
MGARAGLAERLDQFVAANGLKQTQQRRAILEAFLAVEGHVSLDELLVRVQRLRPSVGYATVYRTMKLFVAAGLAHERQFGDGQARFEPVDLDHDHHDHLICRTCGHIFEFEDEEIERRQAMIAGAHGLVIVAHRLDLWGDCAAPEGCPHRAASLRA